METDCGVCGGAELAGDGDVDFSDLNRLVGRWLVGLK